MSMRIAQPRTTTTAVRPKVSVQSPSRAQAKLLNSRDIVMRDPARRPNGARPSVFNPDDFERSACQVLIRLLPHAVVVLNDELTVVMANRAASLLFHTPMERLRGVPVAAILPLPNLSHALGDFDRRRARVFETSIAGCAAARPVLTLRIHAVRVTVPDGGTLSDGGSDHTLLVIEDISDMAVLEQQFVDAEKQAALGQLASGILHEVANPVTSLASNLLFIRGSLAPGASAEVAQALDVSMDQLDHMRQLLGTLSGFPGRPAPRYEVADLHDVVRTCLTFVSKDAERRRIRLSASFAPSIIACEMDVRLIKQVLLNLLKNGMEAMPEGGALEVRTAHHPPGAVDPTAVAIEVADTGIGIPDADLRRVFRPLFSTKPRGAGLGLSFCRQAVEEHGGEIRLVSRGKHQGTIAIVTLPLRQRKDDSG